MLILFVLGRLFNIHQRLYINCKKWYS